MVFRGMAKMGKPRVELNTVTPATKEMKKLLSVIGGCALSLI